MLEKFVRYFVDRHLMTNLIFLTVLIGGVLSWQQIKKEEMPDVTFDMVRVSARYPGATAEEVEHFVTHPLEEAVSGLDGVYLVTSSTSEGSTNIRVELEQDYPNKDEAITEIRNAILDVKLPDDVMDDPAIHVFKTSKKAIIDIALYSTQTHLLDVPARQVLQDYAHALEIQLRNLHEVNSVNKSGYLQEEIQIEVEPDKLIEYVIPLSQVIREVKDGHVRQPAGNVEAKDEPKVTLNAQLDTIEKLQKQIIQAGFEGQAIALKELANVRKGYKKSKEIFKVNGHEAVVLNVVKNSSYGILESLGAVDRVVTSFRNNYLTGTSIELCLLDDESIDLRNRLSIVSNNGMIGFVLIISSLFLFLNKRSGLWVAMGIPFTICFTLLASLLMGFTINNITLAAVIIVMGMVVDDAIVVTENISRLRSQKFSSRDAAVKGTAQVFLPVVASIVTTCVAFVPLYFFSGRFGQVNKFIPPIIFLMLGASLLEALIILPGHMHFEVPRLKRTTASRLETSDVGKIHWFEKVEDGYGRLLQRLLPFKYVVFLIFILLLIGAGAVLRYKMKFVMFPQEETRDIVISAYAPKDANRYDTAELTTKIESILRPHLGKEVVGFITEIARSRRGGAVEENRFRTSVEIVPKEQRKLSADQLVALWRKEIGKIEGLNKLVIDKGRWGQSSGSPIEIIVQENDNQKRESAAEKLAQFLREHPALENVDIERPIMIPEYRIDLQREKVKRLAINPQDIASAFRASLEGSILYDIPKGDEEIDVRLTIREQEKTDLRHVLNVPVENRNDYLVPLQDVVMVEETQTPNAISRWDLKRTTTVYAGIKPDSKKTPLEVAVDLEERVFPQVIKDNPTTALDFVGEVRDTRESGADFKRAVILALFLIFAVLAILFDSLSRPFIIMLAIPFGLVGIVLAFLIHGKFEFGFFAGIGALGLSGVVINDAIILLSKLDGELRRQEGKASDEQIAKIVQTRLRAVVLTTLTTAAGLIPTAYGFAGYDAMLADMMLALAWGLCFGTLVTLLFVPCLYSFIQDMKFKMKNLLFKT